MSREANNVNVCTTISSRTVLCAQEEEARSSLLCLPPILPYGMGLDVLPDGSLRLCRLSPANNKLCPTGTTGQLAEWLYFSLSSPFARDGIPAEGQHIHHKKETRSSESGQAFPPKKAQTTTNQKIHGKIARELSQREGTG
jgi:hypothetical protein